MQGTERNSHKHFFDVGYPGLQNAHLRAESLFGFCSSQNGHQLHLLHFGGKVSKQQAKSQLYRVKYVLNSLRDIEKLSFLAPETWITYI